MTALCVSVVQVEAALLGVHTAQHQQAMPAFAAGMGLLEPSRMSGAMDGMLNPSSAAPLPMDSDADPFSLSARPTAESPLALFGPAPVRTSVPVDRPTSPGGPALLDLSFGALGDLGSVGTTAAPPMAANPAIDLFQSDLMGLDFSSAMGMDTGFSTSAGGSSRNSVSDSLPDQAGTAVSAEVDRVIQSLPDLSFMLSRVLMFPSEVATFA